MIKKIEKMKLLLFTTFISTLLLILCCGKVSAATIMMEAEDAQITRNFTVAEDTAASGGKYIISDNVAAKQSGKDTQIKFEVPEDGFYTFYIRWNSDTSPNSVWYFVDEAENPLYQWVFNGDWVWTRGFTHQLKKGEHTVSLRLRGKLCKIDKFVLTTDVSFSPKGMGEIPEKENSLYTNKTGYALYRLPEVVPTGERPRVMVRKHELPEIRKNLTHPSNVPAYEKIKELAAKETDCTLPESTAINYNAEILAVAEARAFLYLMTEDEKYGEWAKNSILNYMKSLYLGASPGMDPQRYGGHTLFVGACVYDWCYDFFSEEEKQQFVILGEKIAEYFEWGYPPFYDSGKMQLSSLLTENAYIKDLAAFSIAVYDEKPSIYNNNTGMLLEQFIPIRNFRSKAQYNFDGVTYGQYRSWCDIFFNYLMDKIGYKTIFDKNHAYMPYQYIYMRRPDGNFMSDGDYVGATFLLQNKQFYSPLYFLTANLYKDGMIKGVYYKNIVSQEGYGSPDKDYVSFPIYILTNDVSVEPVDYSSLPLTKYFGSPGGVMIARTGWEDGADSNTAVAFMKLPEYFWGSHEHYDAGSFQLYYKGMLALDSGYYSSVAYTDENGKYVSGGSYGSDHDLYYHKATIAHNCMLVYDPDERKDQANTYAGQRLTNNPQSTLTSAHTMEDFLGGDYTRGKILAYDYGPDMHTPEYSYFEANLSPAYTDKVEDYSRAFMFLNLFDEETPAALIVYDRMRTKKSGFEKSWLLHSVQEPEVNGNTTTIRMTNDHNNGRMVNTTLLPEKAEIYKVGGPGKEFLVDKKNYYAKGPERGDEGGAWRIEVAPSRESKQDYFLNVMQVSENDDSIVPLDVNYKEIGDYLGIYIKDRAVFLRKEEGANYKNLTVSAKGAGELSYIVANLVTGLWTVYDEKGKVVFKDTVNGENGVLYFRANAGTYTLKRTHSDNIKKKDFNVLNNLRPEEKTRVNIYYDSSYGTDAYLSENNTVMVNAKDMFKRIGVGEFSEENGKVTVSQEGRVMEIQKGNSFMTIAGEKYDLSDITVENEKGIYVDFEAFRAFYNLKSKYDAVTKILSVNVYQYYVEGADERIYQYADTNVAKIKDLVYSSSINDSLNGYKSVDGNIDTNWSSTEENAYVIYELIKPYKIDKIGIAHYMGYARKQYFELYASEDGVNWKMIHSGEGNGKTANFQDVVFEEPFVAKYIKFVGKGNSSNTINNISDIKIYCVE